jgi:hypothetical protein
MLMYNTTTREVSYNTSGNVSANYFLGNGALLTGLTVTSTLPSSGNIDIAGNQIGVFANVSNIIAAQGNVGNTRFLGGNVAVSGQVNVLGNVVAPFFIGAITGNVIGAYANVANIIAVQGNIGNVRIVGGNIVTSGNITANTFNGTFANIGNVLIGPGYINAPFGLLGQVVFNGDNSIYCSTITASGSTPSTINSAYFRTNGLTEFLDVNFQGQVVAQGNIVAGGQVNVTGNIAGNYFIGNGSRLTGITATLPTTTNLDIRGNVIGAYANVANIIAVQGNIGNTRFLGGNVAVSGQVNTLGNVVAPFFVGNGSRLTGVVAGVLPTVIYADIQDGNIRGANLVSVENIISDYILSTGGSIGGTLLDTSGDVSIRGDLQVPFGNIIYSGLIYGNGSQLTGVISTLPGTANIDIRGNVIGEYANVANIIAVQGNIGGITFRGGNVTAPFFIGAVTGNVIGTYANVANIIALQGNVGNTRFLGGNVAVSGQINTLGNVVAPFFVGDVIGNIVAVQGNVGNARFLGGNVAVSGQINTLGNVVAPFHIGDVIGNVVAVQGNVGNTRFLGGNVAVSGQVNALGNVVAPFFVGDVIGNIVAVQGNVGNTRFLGGNVAVSGQVVVLGNVSAPFFVGNGSLLTGINAGTTLPDLVSRDIRGNIIGPYANVSNIIAVQGNIANVIFNAGNVTTPGFVYQGIRSVTYTGSGTQAAANTTPNIAVQFPTTALSTGTVDITRQNTNTRFINLTSSTRLFQVNASIPIGIADGGTSARTCEAYILYTASGGSKVKITAAADSRPNMNAGNDNGQVLNMGTLITLAANDYFEIFANAVTTQTNVVNLAMTNPTLANPVITIVQLN